MKNRLWITVFLLTACMAQPNSPTPTLRSVSVFVPFPTETITLTPQIRQTIYPSATPILAPYKQFSIEYLRTRSYGGGTLDVGEKLAEHEKYTTYTVRYKSDGLDIYGVMNIPNGDALYPLVISVHGYTPPDKYYILDTDFSIENRLAEEGYITIHPALRNYAPSDSGDNLFRVGDTIDILNLIAIVKAQSGSGILQKANPAYIGLGGRSMGGGIVLRVLTITTDVKAAYLYSPTSGDEARNVEFFNTFARRDSQFKGEVDAPADAIDRMSPQSYFGDITASILLAHGESDRIIPVSWTEDTCNLMKEIGLQKRCIYYQGADHTFYDNDLEDFIDEILKYFAIHLRQ